VCEVRQIAFEGAGDSWGEQVFLCESHNMQVLPSDSADKGVDIKRLLKRIVWVLCDTACHL